MGTRSVLLVALAAAGLGAGAALWLGGPGPLLRSEVGQRIVRTALQKTAPAPPSGLVIAGRGDPMPALYLRDLDGNVAELPGNYAGQPMLVNFWASWCGPCIREMPELDRYARRRGDHAAQVIGIALDQPDDVQAFLQRTAVVYPILIDPPGPRDSSVQLGNPTGVLPYSVLIGADGRVVKQKLGPFQPGEIEAWVAGG